MLEGVNYIKMYVRLIVVTSSDLDLPLNWHARILSTIRHFHNKWWRIADDVLCVFNLRARRHFQWRGKYYISRPFASSNSRTSSAGKLDWFHVNELQELVWEPVLCDILDDCILPRGSVPFVFCTEQPRTTVTREKTL